MSTLTITRGLPGSGKSTCARAWVSADPAHRAEVNRDHLRAMLHDGTWLGDETERQVVAARDAVILELLRLGQDVICSDTNLPEGIALDLARLAARAQAGLEILDFTDVPLGTCIARDAARNDKNPVGEAVIRDMHARYLQGASCPLPLPDLAADDVAVAGAT
jgi:tRNA uridine 5-carbamoylmethylation protein Kti12